jgi:hypothetical protein
MYTHIKLKERDEDNNNNKKTKGKGNNIRHTQKLYRENVEIVHIYKYIQFKTGQPKTIQRVLSNDVVLLASELKDMNSQFTSVLSTVHLLIKHTTISVFSFYSFLSLSLFFPLSI